MKEKDQEGWAYYEQGGEAGKNDRKHRWRRTSFIVMMLSCLALIFLGYHNHQQAAQDSKFCVQCHEMKPSYDAWKTTSHSKVACLECHKNVSIAADLYKHLIGVNRISQIKVEVDDTACRNCHSDTRVITPPQSLLVPHNLHVQMGLSCTKCHRTVAHGSVVKTVVANVPGQSGPLLQGENLFDPNRIPMAGCMKCHNGSMATRTCDACHADKAPPDSHRASDFKSGHGYVALQNIQMCNNCHQYDATLQAQYKPAGAGWNASWSFARKTDFCIECHKKRPVGHQNFYTVIHGPSAKQDINRCLTCHNWDDKGAVPEKPASSVICTQCHYNQHPPNFQQIHPSIVNKDNQSKCFGCHDATSCNQCHNRTFRAARK